MPYIDLLRRSIDELQAIATSGGLNLTQQGEIQSIVNSLREAISHIDSNNNGTLCPTSTEVNNYTDTLENTLKAAGLNLSVRPSIETVINELREAVQFIKDEEGKKLEEICDGLRTREHLLRQTLHLIRERKGEINPGYLKALANLGSGLDFTIGQLMEDNGISPDDLKPTVTITKLRAYLEMIKKQAGIPFRNDYINLSAQTYELEVDFKNGVFSEEDYQVALNRIHRRILDFFEDYNLNPISFS